MIDQLPAEGNYGFPYDMPEAPDFLRRGHTRSKLWMRNGRLECKDHVIDTMGDMRDLILWLCAVYERAASPRS